MLARLIQSIPPLLLVAFVPAVDAQQPTYAAPPQQPSAAPLPPAAAYSARLGTSFQLVPYGNGLGARVAAPPAPGSPLGQPQIQLEPGDTIIALDGQAIRGTADLESHYDQTSVTFINVRTGQAETRWATLPPLGVNPGPFPQPNPGPFPQPNPGPALILGVTGVPVQVANQVGFGAGAIPGQISPVQTALRVTTVFPGTAAALAGIQTGETILTINNFTVSDINTLRQAVAASGGVCQITVQGFGGVARTVTAYPAPSGVQPTAPIQPPPFNPYPGGNVIGGPPVTPIPFGNINPR